MNQMTNTIGSVEGEPGGRNFKLLSDIPVNGTLVAKGEVVTVNGRFGVRVVDVVATDARVAGLERRT